MVSLIFFIIAVGIFLLRKDCRREMVWSGLFTLPLFLLLPVFNQNFFEILDRGNIVHFLVQIVGVFSIGAFVSAGYKFFFHRHLVRYKHPKSHLLAYLVVGPILLVILNFIPQIRFAYAISASLLLDMLILVVIRNDLLVDAIFSGLVMAVTYGVSLIIQPYILPGRLNDFWFGPVSGLNLLFTPVEEIIIIMLFGMLMGPLYAAVNDLFERKFA